MRAAPMFVQHVKGAVSRLQPGAELRCAMSALTPGFACASVIVRAPKGQRRMRTKARGQFANQSRRTIAERRIVRAAAPLSFVTERQRFRRKPREPWRRGSCASRQFDENSILVQQIHYATEPFQGKIVGRRLRPRPKARADRDEIHSCAPHQRHVFRPERFRPCLRVEIAAVNDLGQLRNQHGPWVFTSEDGARKQSRQRKKALDMSAFGKSDWNYRRARMRSTGSPGINVCASSVGIETAKGSPNSTFTPAACGISVVEIGSSCPATSSTVPCATSRLNVWRRI